MKFITNTKPLTDVLSLMIIKANVNKYDSKSCLLQLKANKHNLILNVEYDRIITEVILHGSGDSDTSLVATVDSMLFKKLIGTITSTTVTLEFVEGGLVIYSGASKFTVPNKADVDNLELAHPVMPTQDSEAYDTYDICPDDWGYVMDHQLYAIAASFVSPIYTLVWVSNSSGVLVGDDAKGIFIKSSKVSLPKTCLLRDSVVRLFANLPDGAKMITCGDSYLVQVSTDGFDLTTQIDHIILKSF